MPLFVVGAGGLGRETLDAAIAAGIEVDGFLDDGLAGTTVRGLAVLVPASAPPGAAYVVGIAAPDARSRLSDVLDGGGLSPLTVVHPRAVVGPETTLGAGCVVLAQAHVSSSVRVGRHSHVHYNATVGHDAVLGDYVTVYPGANVSGSVVLADAVTVGSNAVVLQGRTVGAGAFVGAGAVVTHDVAPGAVVAGNPARELRRS
jgi:sugar O-acyltransferase (sialic acid O-acetyltransferase NeuD family)